MHTVPPKKHPKPAMRWAGKYIELEARLDQVLADTRRLGLAEDAALDAIFAWAVRRAYETAGYSATRVLMLNALEDILIREVRSNTR